jgi:hypothetical protein
MSNRDIFLWLIGTLIAVGVMIWTAIYVMDHYLFAENRAGPAMAVGAACCLPEADFRLAIAYRNAPYPDVATTPRFIDF